jgi:hypothetical protein
MYPMPIMRYYAIAIFVFQFIACSSPDKENKTSASDNANHVKPAMTVESDPNWASYIDTINMGFVVSFKYPKRLFAEHLENAERIGTKIKLVDDGPMTTMDCSMWMNDTTAGSLQPIDTLIQCKLQTLKVNATVLKDTIVIANVKGARVRFYDVKDTAKLLQQSVFFTKYATFFELYNDSLPANDFDIFVKSLKIEK